MEQTKCTNFKRLFAFWYYLRLCFTALIIWPAVLVLTITRKILLSLQRLRISRPIIKEPIHFIRSESVKEIDDWKEEDDEEKKTQEWLKAFDDPQVLENARFIAEYNFKLELKPQPPYNEYDDPLV